MTAEQIAAENERICEKLLGWIPCLRRITDGAREWKTQQSTYYLTPTFDGWAEAGLILDALQLAGKSCEVGWNCEGGDWFSCISQRIDEYGDTGPLAIRAAALTYIEALRS